MRTGAPMEPRLPSTNNVPACPNRLARVHCRGVKSSPGLVAQSDAPHVAGGTSELLKGSCFVPLDGSSQTSLPKPMPSKSQVEAFAAKPRTFDLRPRRLSQSAENAQKWDQRVGVDSALLADNKPFQTSFSLESVDGRSEIDPQRGAVGWWLHRQRRHRAQKNQPKQAK